VGRAETLAFHLAYHTIIILAYKDKDNNNNNFLLPKIQSEPIKTKCKIQSTIHRCRCLPNTYNGTFVIPFPIPTLTPVCTSELFLLFFFVVFWVFVLVFVLVFVVVVLCCVVWCCLVLELVFDSAPPRFGWTGRSWPVVSNDDVTSRNAVVPAVQLHYFCCQSFKSLLHILSRLCTRFYE